MGFDFGGIIKTLIDPSTPMKIVSSLVDGKKKAGGGKQTVASQIAAVTDQAQQQSAADQLQIQTVQSQLVAAQSSQKKIEIGAAVLVVIAIGLAVLMGTRKKKTT